MQGIYIEGRRPKSKKEIRHIPPVQCVKDAGHDGPHDIGCTRCGSVLVEQDNALQQAYPKGGLK